MKKWLLSSLKIITISLLVWGIPKLVSQYNSDPRQTENSRISSGSETNDSQKKQEYEGILVWEFRKMTLKNQKWELVRNQISPDQLWDGKIINCISSQNSNMLLYEAVKLCK